MSEAAKLTDERLLSIRKQYLHRAHGESRDENDSVAQELADVANAIDELLRLRSSLPPDAAGGTEKCDTCGHTRFVDVNRSPASTIPDAAGERAADERKAKLLLPFLDEMSKHANWCRKMGSDAANCTCPAEAAAYEAAQIREHIAALSPASTRGQQ